MQHSRGLLDSWLEKNNAVAFPRHPVKNHPLAQRSEGSGKAGLAEHLQPRPAGLCSPRLSVPDLRVSLT